ncbi:MAG: hypothetical protein V4525_17130 [Pseudomonadota bacterium]
MARWTQTYQDQEHIVAISEVMPIGGVVEVFLLDGTRIEGVMRRANLGNNAGKGGWSYHGECEIEDKNKQRWVIDYLDVRSANKFWNDAIADEYKKLGLITDTR